jgi:hypothetical protein
VTPVGRDGEIEHFWIGPPLLETKIDEIAVPTTKRNSVVEYEIAGGRVIVKVSDAMDDPPVFVAVKVYRVAACSCVGAPVITQADDNTKPVGRIGLTEQL